MAKHPMLNTGILMALCAYACWGLLPIYWKLLQHVPADQLLGHRIVWSFAALIIFLKATRRAAALRRSLNPASCPAKRLIDDGVTQEARYAGGWNRR